MPPQCSRRWPGVFLSFVVPGFGLYRAGLTQRAILWFLGILGVHLAAALALVTPSIPAAVGFLAVPLAMLILLADSFRPGRMTLRKWVVFAGCFLLLAALPAPALQIFHVFNIPTVSMAPTLRPGDYFVVNRVAYEFQPIRRGDVIAFQTEGIAGITEHSIYLKRVAAFGGEKVQIRGGAFLVNGKPITPADGLPALGYTSLRLPNAFLDSEEASYEVPAGSVFVLGDNLAHSADSRLWGGVPVGNVYGKAVKIYYPFSRMGVIK